MKTLPALCAIFFLTFLGTQAQAQTNGDLTPEMAAKELPQSLSLSLQIAYVCQGVLGSETYQGTRDTVTTILVKMLSDGEDDASARTQAADFVKTAEDEARSMCPDKTTCWRELLKMPQGSEAEGKTACAGAVKSMLEHTLGLLQIIYKSDS